MKLSKKDVYVFIENEQQLQEARELLERFGQPIYEPFFNLDGDCLLIQNDGANDKDWFLSDHDCLNYPRTRITLPELEQILKEEHGKILQ